MPLLQLKIVISDSLEGACSLLFIQICRFPSVDAVDSTILKSVCRAQIISDQEGGILVRCHQVSVLRWLLRQQLLQLVGHGAHAQVGSVEELLLAGRIALAVTALVHLKCLALGEST